MEQSEPVVQFKLKHCRNVIMKYGQVIKKKKEKEVNDVKTAEQQKTRGSSQRREGACRPVSWIHKEMM